MGLEKPASAAREQDDRGIGLSFLLLVLVTPMGSSLALSGLAPALPAISAHFAHVPYSDSLVRGLVTVVSLAMVVGAPIAGVLVERFGARRVLLSAALIFTASGLAGLVIDSLPMLLASRLVLGLAEVTVSTTVLALIARRLEAEHRNRWMGWYVGAGAIATLLWIELAGLVTDYNWRFIFLFHAIGIVILISAAMAVPAGEEPAYLAEKRARPRLPTLAAIASIIPLVGLAIASGAIENTTFLFLPFHLADMGETSAARISYVLMPACLGVGMSSLLYARVRRHLSISGVYILCFLLAGVMLPFIGFAQTFAVTAVLAFLLGLTVGMLAPNIYAFAAVYGSQEHQARHIGIARGAFFVGAPAAQLFLEPIATSAGSGMAIVALGCVSLLLMLWILTQGRRLIGNSA